LVTSRKYVVAVGLLAVLAVAFGVFGTVAPPLTEESAPIQPQQESSESLAHFANPPTYDSGWVDIRDKRGQHFNFTHNLNTTETFVDIRGRQNQETGGEHQINLGATKFTPMWNRTYGGAYWDEAYSLVQTSDGGYAMAGGTNPSGSGFSDFLLVKTDLNGNMQWNRTYNCGAEDDVAYSLVQTSDEGYILAGSNTPSHIRTDWWLMKTDATGNMLWNMTGGGTDMDETHSAVETEDGGYALAGYTKSLVPNTRYDFLLIRVGAECGLTWTSSTDKTITVYRGRTDTYWNYVRVRTWVIKEPTWIYGDINMDGIVDAKDLYIVGRNYGKTLSLLSLTGMVVVAGISTVKKRKQDKQPN